MMKGTLPLLLACIPFLAQAQWSYEWARQSSSANVENATNCAVAADGHVAVTGDFQTDLQVSTFTGDGQPGNGLRGFVAYYDADGAFQWAHVTSSYHPSGANCQAWDVAIDGDGNVFVGGQFNDSLLLDGVKVLDRPNSVAEGAHVFHVLKFSPSGVLLWASATAVEGFTGYLHAIAVDGNGDVYLVGTGGFQYGHFFKLDGGTGATIFDFTTTGAGAVIGDVTTDAANNVYITGLAGNVFTMGGMQCPFNNVLGGGSTSLFVGKFNSIGEAQWYYVPDQTGSGYYGFPEGNIAASADGDVFVETRRRIRINGDTMNDGNGTTQALFALHPDGTVRWARSVNTTGQVTVNDIHCDGQGNVLLAGQSYGPTIDLVDTVINSSVANFNVFVGRYDGATGTLDRLLNGPAVTEVTGVGLDADDGIRICGTFSGNITLDDALTGSWNMFVTRLHESTVGIPELGDVPALTLFPNPSNGTFRLIADGRMQGTLDVEVIDARGVIVRSQRLASPTQDITLDIAPGPYLVRTHDAAGNVANTRVIVQR